MLPLAYSHTDENGNLNISMYAMLRTARVRRMENER